MNFSKTRFFSEYTDFGNCVYHSDCCDTIYVSKGGSQAGLVGTYSKIYVEQNPYAYYKKQQDAAHPEDVYIHFRIDLNRWVFSSNYWDTPKTIAGDIVYSTVTKFLKESL